MITVYNHDTYDCVQSEFLDESSKVRVHFHKSGHDTDIRQIHISSVEDGDVLSWESQRYDHFRMPCDEF